MLNKILSLFSLFISICAFVYLFNIRNDTKIDTFQQPFEPGKKDKFFLFFSNITSADIGIKCELNENSILYSGVNKLGDVFYLNIESIHTKSTQLLIILTLTIIFLVLSILGIYFISPTKYIFAVFFYSILVLINLALFICNLIITALLILDFYKGDTQNFIEYLNCANVNREEFSKYFFAEKLNKDFKVFIVLNFIGLFINYNLIRKRRNNEQEQSGQRKVEIVESK